MFQKQVKFEVKSLEAGQFEGYASVFGNIDSDGEVIDKGAFKRTIDHSGGVVPILWQHDRNRPVGWNVSAEEDGRGLKVRGDLMTDTEDGKTAIAFLKKALEIGGKPGLSIGFTVPSGGDYFKDGTRHFKEVALKEYSIVTFPANELATATSAKGGGKTKRVDGVDLPPSSFAYVGDPEKTETWKLPIEFPGDEAKTESHIRNALARFSQTQGIPAGERAAVLAKIKRAAKEHGIDAGDKSQNFEDTLETSKKMSALHNERYQIESALYGSVQGTHDDLDLSPDEKKAQIAESYAQYADTMADWHSRLIDMKAEDDVADEKNAKEGRTISGATRSNLRRAIGYMMEGENLHRQGSDAHKRGLGVLSDLSEGRYANDVNKPNPVGGGKSEEESDPDQIHSLLEAMQGLAQKTTLAK